MPWTSDYVKQQDAIPNPVWIFDSYENVKIISRGNWFNDPVFVNYKYIRKSLQFTEFMQGNISQSKSRYMQYENVLRTLLHINFF